MASRANRVSPGIPVGEKRLTAHSVLSLLQYLVAEAPEGPYIP